MIQSQILLYFQRDSQCSSTGSSQGLKMDEKIEFSDQRSSFTEKVEDKISGQEKISDLDQSS